MHKRNVAPTVIKQTLDSTLRLSLQITLHTMAEAFGIISGAVSIAAIFTTCVDCFGYVQLGRHFGRDFQTDLLTLNLLRLRLSRWGTAVHIYDDPQLGNPRATKSKLRIAKDTLFQILVLFSDSEKTSKKFHLGATHSLVPVYKTSDIQDSMVADVNNKMQELAIKRQRGSSLLKLTSWALYNREKFSKLLGSITSLLDKLEKLFPAPEAEKQLAEQEIKLMADASTLELLQKLASGVDKILQSRAKKDIATRHGHSYAAATIGENAIVLDGDFYDTSWNPQGRFIVDGGSHTYGASHIRGHAKVQRGDRHGKDIF
jgi:hypothetical protein